jgi:hypothetical protein
MAQEEPFFATWDTDEFDTPAIQRQFKSVIIGLKKDEPLVCFQDFEL